MDINNYSYTGSSTKINEIVRFECEGKMVFLSEVSNTMFQAHSFVVEDVMSDFFEEYDNLDDAKKCFDKYTGTADRITAEQSFLGGFRDLTSEEQELCPFH